MKRSELQQVIGCLIESGCSDLASKVAGSLNFSVALIYK